MKQSKIDNNVHFLNYAGSTLDMQFSFSNSGTFQIPAISLASYGSIFAATLSSNGRLEAVVPKTCLKSQNLTARQELSVNSYRRNH